MCNEWIVVVLWCFKCQLSFALVASQFYVLHHISKYVQVQNEKKETTVQKQPN